MGQDRTRKRSAPQKSAPRGSTGRSVSPRRPGSSRSRTRSGSRTGSGAGAYLAIPAFVAVYLVVNAVWPLPIWVAGVYIAASAGCFIAYAVDKSAARAGRWRVPESTLLVWGVVGGWPGAILAQQTLRHKTKKASFRAAFWGTVVLNVVVFVGLTALLMSDVMSGVMAG